MTNSEAMEMLEAFADKHKLLLSTELINFADDIWEVATLAERQAHALAKEIEETKELFQTPVKSEQKSWVATVFFDGKPSQVYGLFVSEKDALDWVETNYDGWDASVVQPLVYL
jgi:hypothetical protein